MDGYLSRHGIHSSYEVRRHLQKNKKSHLIIKQEWSFAFIMLNVEELAIFCLEASFFGLNITDVQRLTYQIAEQNNIPHKFYLFMKRHPNLRMLLLPHPKESTEKQLKFFLF